MDSIKLWARNGEAVRQALELGEIAHIETASEELTDEFLVFAIESDLLKSWAGSFPDPRCEPEIAAYSARRLPLIPVETCHRFQPKIATDSG